MVDPDREARQKIRAIIAGEVGQSSTPPPAVPQSARRGGKRAAIQPRTVGPGENPFGDGVTVLPGDWKEQPLN